MSFNRGDNVLVNSGLLAVIDNYDEQAGVVVYTTNIAGGGTDTTTARIGTVNIEKVPSLDDAVANDPAEPDSVVSIVKK